MTFCVWNPQPVEKCVIGHYVTSMDLVIATTMAVGYGGIFLMFKFKTYLGSELAMLFL